MPVLQRLLHMGVHSTWCKCIAHIGMSVCAQLCVHRVPTPEPLLSTCCINKWVFLPSLCAQNYQGGEFSLFFANCEPYSAIDFDVEAALFNVRGEWRCLYLGGHASCGKMHRVGHTSVGGAQYPGG